MAPTSEATLVTPKARSAKAPYGKLRPGPGKSASEVAAHQRARIHSAMAELAVERGYEAVTVRELMSLAKVSTRSFYKHFKDSEDCFLQTYDLIAQRTVGRIIASQAGERDWEKRLRLAFAAFARELKREPYDARLALVEAYTAGPAALERMRRAERTFEVMIAESFAKAPDGTVVPPLIVKGLVAGITRLSRERLLGSKANDLRPFGDALMEWTLCYRSKAAAELLELDRKAVAQSLRVKAMFPIWLEQWNSQSISDDRTLILNAVAKLVVADGYAGLTIPRVLAASGIPRRSFKAEFSGVEECFLAAVQLRADEAIAHAARALASASTWEGGIYRAMAVLCAQVAQDPLLARLCFVDIFSLAGGMECREHLMASIATLVQDSMPPAQRPNVLQIEASVGAIWGILQHQVVSGRAQELPRIAATLTFLALAPGTGAQSATEAIRREHAGG